MCDYFSFFSELERDPKTQLTIATNVTTEFVNRANENEMYRSVATASLSRSATAIAYDQLSGLKNIEVNKAEWIHSEATHIMKMQSD